MYAGGANFTSLFFMNVYRIYIFIIWFVFTPLLMIWQKGGEEFWSFIYACLFSCLMHICFVYAKMGEVFMQKGEKYLESFFIFIFSFMHICVVWFMHSLNIFIVYCYAWVKGELLWCLTLIHAYITPWVLSSSKRGRLLAQRPSTLVLMMINSCS